MGRKGKPTKDSKLKSTAEAAGPGGRKLDGWDRTILAIVVISAFALSFAALTDLAARSGIDPRLAWMWPVTVDGLIVGATRVAARRRHGPGSLYARSMVVAGVVVSIAANAAHAMLPPGDLPDIVVALVAAVPPAALLATTHLIISPYLSVVEDGASVVESAETVELADAEGAVRLPAQQPSGAVRAADTEHYRSFDERHPIDNGNQDAAQPQPASDVPIWPTASPRVSDPELTGSTPAAADVDRPRPMVRAEVESTADFVLESDVFDRAQEGRSDYDDTSLYEPAPLEPVLPPQDPEGYGVSMPGWVDEDAVRSTEASPHLPDWWRIAKEARYQGESIAEISRIVGVSEKTVSKWLNRAGLGGTATTAAPLR